MTSTAHTARTPGPWATYLDTRVTTMPRHAGMHGLLHESVADCRNEADAAFIVTACNTHDELVAALNECADRLEQCAIAGGSDKEYAALAVSKYRAALAKVQP